MKYLIDFFFVLVVGGISVGHYFFVTQPRQPNKLYPASTAQLHYSVPLCLATMDKMPVHLKKEGYCSCVQEVVKRKFRLPQDSLSASFFLQTTDGVQLVANCLRANETHPTLPQQEASVRKNCEDKLKKANHPTAVCTCFAKSVAAFLAYRAYFQRPRADILQFDCHN